MNNYEYIIASLPDLTKDWKFPDGTDESPILEFIIDNCSKKDKQLVDTLLEGFKEELLNKEFYEKALSCKNSFIKEYFTLDLNIRNTKVEFLNKSLNRPLEQDIFMRPEGEFEDISKLEDIFSDNDLLARERKLDDFVWERIDELIVFKYFDIDVILAFIAKLHIVSRWLKLDEQKGREMFRKLVNEVRNTFKGVPKDITLK